MDEVKGKVKDLFKKVNRSSGKFKGQGRVLGSSSSSQPSTNSLPPYRQPPNQSQQKPKAPPPQEKPKRESQMNPKQDLPKIQSSLSDMQISDTDLQISDNPANSVEFDPYGSYIGSTARPRSGTSLNMVECPVCTKFFRSEEEVNAHIEGCLATQSTNKEIENCTEKEIENCTEKEIENCTNNESGNYTSKEAENYTKNDEAENYKKNDEAESFIKNEEAGNNNDNSLEEKVDDLRSHVGVFLSGNPFNETVDVVLKLLRNIASDPSNGKFRRIRMNNPKIQSTVGLAIGGVEVLECVGFKFEAEGEDVWGSMDLPSEEGVSLIGEVVSMLDCHLIDSSKAAEKKEEVVVPKKIDRQVRVFFAAPENIAARIELPESFYVLSTVELKREAEARKKKMEDSKLLIPKSLREKQAKAARRRYRASIIRIQFPDGVILQGVFLPNEPTTALYEFVSSALKGGCLEFELIQLTFPRSRVVPCMSEGEGKIPLLEDEDLVPSALLKFKPKETDNIVYMGLSDELLEISEPLTSTSDSAQH